MDNDLDGDASEDGHRVDPLYERLVQSTSDAVVAFDASGDVVFANDATGRMTGHEPTDLTGQPVERLLPERLRSWFREIRDTYVETGRRTVDWHGLELLVRRPDGTELPVSVTMATHDADGELCFSATIRDASTAVERRENLERTLAARDELVAELAAALATARTTLQSVRDGTSATGVDDDADIDGALAEATAALEAADHAVDDMDDPAAASGRGDGGPETPDTETEAETAAGGDTATGTGTDSVTRENGGAGAETSGSGSGSGVTGGGATDAATRAHETASVSLPDIAAEAWEAAGIDGMLRLDGFGPVRADADDTRELLRVLFSKLAAAHGGAIDVRVGPTDDGDGFHLTAAQRASSVVGAVVQLADARGWSAAVDTDGDRRRVVVRTAPTPARE